MDQFKPSLRSWAELGCFLRVFICVPQRILRSMTWNAQRKEQWPASASSRKLAVWRTTHASFTKRFWGSGPRKQQKQPMLKEQTNERGQKFHKGSARDCSFATHQDVHAVSII